MGEMFLPPLVDLFFIKSLKKPIAERLSLQGTNYDESAGILKKVYDHNLGKIMMLNKLGTSRRITDCPVLC